MGGQLTSRLHVVELESGDLKSVRPLYNDDVSTADRHFGLHKGQDDAKIATAKKELDRLRYLATIKHPFVPNQRDDSIVAAAPPKTEFELDIFKIHQVPKRMEERSVNSSSLDVQDETQTLSHGSSTSSQPTSENSKT